VVVVTQEPKTHDEAPAIISDHPFEPRGEWWSLCKHCGLAQAAHSSSTINSRMEMLREHMETYGEIRHVDPVQKELLGREFRDYERERIHSGGRVRMGYVSDDFPDEDD
jgi:hypothetical protein